MDMQLKGKVALVTGGARDVGREIALSLAAEGATVAVNYNGSRSGAEAVVAEIERRGGDVVRNPKTEASIFKSFMTRWPENSVAIARAAFEVHDGMWRSAPISLNRFCKASDPYFAAIIAKNL